REDIMNKTCDKKYYLTLLTTLTTLFVSFLGFINQTIYTDRINQITKYELMGQDVVTIVISLIFLCIIIFFNYSKIQTKILWLGCLLYQFYIYAYYTFGGITSVFYLLYIAITGLSLFLFFFLLSDIIKTHNYPIAGKKYPRKSLSIFLWLTVLMVTIIELQELVVKTILDKNALNPFYVFYILDLCIIFPLIVITSFLNFKKSEFGYLLSAVSLIKIITILPAVIFNDIFHKIYVGYFLDLTFDIIAFFITMTGILFIILFFKNIESKDVSGTSYNSA
ncbi:MAG: hypothetical protein WC957_05670, partial [Candidatus Neomarinimicrobiota bacterium]